MRMNSKSLGKAQGCAKPEPDATPGLTGCVTCEQKNFAKVVGQALATAWRCKWQQETAQASTPVQHE